MLVRKIEGYLMALDPDDKGISRILLSRGKREECFMWVLRHEAYGIGLDVGANIGYCTLPMAKVCDCVYAYEPDGRNYKQLKRNLRLNNVTNVKTERQVLSDKGGFVKLWLTARPNLNSIFLRPKIKTVRRESVKSTVLNNLKFVPNFIKMDIEGGETSVIHGGMDMIQRGTPMKILIEVHPSTYGPKNDFALVLNWLISQKFSFKYVISAKGRTKKFRHRGYEAVKKFRGLDRAVFQGVPSETAIKWATTMPEDGKKFVRAILLERK